MSGHWIESKEMRACLPGCSMDPGQGTLQGRQLFPSLLACVRGGLRCRRLNPRLFRLPEQAASGGGWNFSWIQVSSMHRSVGALSLWASLLMGTPFSFLLQFQLLLDVALYSEHFFSSLSSSHFFFLFPAAYGSICLHFRHFRQLAPLPLLLKTSFKFSLSIWMLGVRAVGDSWSDLSKMKHATASQILAFRL